MIKWELKACKKKAGINGYNCDGQNYTLSDLGNKLGKEGWEFVQVIRDTTEMRVPTGQTVWTAYFKRPYIDDANSVTLSEALRING